ncbi:MAG: hypothetical protein HY094_06095 [Candidatus Melainabacteria bacterium]|nr:hypothetical protein [Candidatus Melainabacteria bacterium]
MISRNVSLGIGTGPSGIEKPAQSNEATTDQVTPETPQEVKLEVVSASVTPQVALVNKNYDGYELALTEEELSDMLDKLTFKIVFNPEEPYNALSPGDKKALSHLVKAAEVLNYVFLQQDHEKNIPLKIALEEAAKNGDEHAKKALKIFNIFNGIEGKNGLNPEPIRLFKGLSLNPGKNVFPSDITKEELVKYLKKNVHKASQILSSDTIVRRDGNELVGIPYSIYFRKEYELAARELLLAASETTHQGLANYLRLQAQALVTPSDPEFAYKADVAWANLEGAPLEFTIGRECYDDELTGQAVTDPELSKLFEVNGITSKKKDSIGVRVGIDNKDVSIKLAKYKSYLKELSQLMPLKERYKQSVDISTEIKQSLSDVHMVYLTGDYASLRPGIVIAQNLPNPDKLSVQLGEARKNVFHKEVREGYDRKLSVKLLENLVEPAYHKWYTDEASALFVLMHELSHSLGPMKTESGKDKEASLGDYGSIFEENKADLGSLICNKYLKEIGEHSEEKLNQIYLTWAVKLLPLSKPTLDQTHRLGELMQLNYFMKHGAIKFGDSHKLNIELEKMGIVARQMLEEVISIQLDGNEGRAKAFVYEYTQWNDTLEYIILTKKSLSPRPLKVLEMPLAEKLLHK